MALSPVMSRWVSERIAEAHEILNSRNSTPSQRTVARLVIAQHGSK
jgi:hypothetical protein